MSRSTFRSAIGYDVRLEIKEVIKGYGNNKVLSGFSLDIKKGEVMCLLGSNGSGKTTLVNIITGLTELDGGDVLLNLENSSLISLKNDKKKFRSYIRLCQQNDFLFEELTGEEHLKLICKLRGITDRESIEDEIQEKS
jgi:ABC-type multidrug transport system ATPase subunit